MRTMNLLASTMLLTCGLGTMACAEQKKPPVDSYAITTARPRVAEPTERNGDAVVLSDALQAKCAMPTMAQAPKFEFDSPVLVVGGREQLDTLARCLTSGALHGQKITLVGRADPRGEQEYNMALGSSRAVAVAIYLRSLGVPTSQLQTSSRGELDAVGVDELTWAIDRRVDVTAS